MRIKTEVMACCKRNKCPQVYVERAILDTGKVGITRVVVGDEDQGQQVAFDPAAFSDFIRYAKEGTYDHLVQPE